MNIFKRIKAVEEAIKVISVALRSMRHCSRCGSTFLRLESKITGVKSLELIYGAVIDGKAYCQACAPAIHAEIKAIELFRAEYSAEKAKLKEAKNGKAK